MIFAWGVRRKKKEVQFLLINANCVGDRSNRTLYEVEDAEIALLRVYGEDEVERSVVSINELRALSPFGNDAFQVVAERVRPLRHLLEDAVYHAFLRFFADLRCCTSKLHRFVANQAGDVGRYWP